MSTSTLDKQLLTYLSEVGIGRYRELTIFFKQTLPQANSEQEIYNQTKSIWDFLEALQYQNFIKVDFDYKQAKEEIVVSGKHSVPINVMILRDGMEYIQSNKEHDVKTNVTFNAKNIKYTGAIGNNNTTTNNEPPKEKKTKPDIPEKVNKWVAMVVAAVVAIPTIIIAWQQIATKNDKKETKTDSIQNSQKNMHQPKDSSTALLNLQKQALPVKNDTSANKGEPVTKRALSIEKQKPRTTRGSTKNDSHQYVPDTLTRTFDGDNDDMVFVDQPVSDKSIDACIEGISPTIPIVIYTNGDDIQTAKSIANRFRNKGFLVKFDSPPYSWVSHPNKFAYRYMHNGGDRVILMLNYYYK